MKLKTLQECSRYFFQLLYSIWEDMCPCDHDRNESLKDIENFENQPNRKNGDHMESKDGKSNVVDVDLTNRKENNTTDKTWYKPITEPTKVN